MLPAVLASEYTGDFGKQRGQHTSQGYGVMEGALVAAASNDNYRVISSMGEEPALQTKAALTSAFGPGFDATPWIIEAMKVLEPLFGGADFMPFWPLAAGGVFIYLNRRKMTMVVALCSGHTADRKGWARKQYFYTAAAGVVSLLLCLARCLVCKDMSIPVSMGLILLRLSEAVAKVASSYRDLLRRRGAFISRPHAHALTDAARAPPTRAPIGPSPPHSLSLSPSLSQAWRAWRRRARPPRARAPRASSRSRRAPASWVSPSRAGA